MCQCLRSATRFAWGRHRSYCPTDLGQVRVPPLRDSSAAPRRTPSISGRRRYWNRHPLSDPTTLADGVSGIGVSERDFHHLGESRNGDSLSANVSRLGFCRPTASRRSHFEIFIHSLCEIGRIASLLLPRDFVVSDWGRNMKRHWHIPSHLVAG